MEYVMEIDRGDYGDETVEADSMEEAMAFAKQWASDECIWDEDKSVKLNVWCEETEEQKEITIKVKANRASKEKIEKTNKGRPTTSIKKASSTTKTKKNAMMKKLK